MSIEYICSTIGNCAKVKAKMSIMWWNQAIGLIAWLHFCVVGLLCWLQAFTMVTKLHTGLIGSKSFHNYAFKGCIFFKTLKLWLLLLTENTFLIAQHFQRNEKNPQGQGHCRKNSKQILKLFHLLYRCAPRHPRGVKEAPTSGKLQFGELCNMVTALQIYMLRLVYVIG